MSQNDAKNNEQYILAETKDLSNFTSPSLGKLTIESLNIVGLIVGVLLVLLDGSSYFLKSLLVAWQPKKPFGT